VQVDHLFFGTLLALTTAEEKGKTMKHKLNSLHYLLIVCALLVIAYTPFLIAQSGQMGFSSIMIDKSSNGTVTNASSEMIEDEHQNWVTNRWAGYYMYLTNDNGTGQAHKIISNTAMTISVSPSFTEIPSPHSNFIIRRGYKSNTQGLKLRLYLQYNDGNRSGGRINGYSCRIQASDTSAVEFVSVEQGSGLGKAWTPTYYVPAGKGQINWLVLPISESQPMASNLYNIATITFNLLKTQSDKAITFYIANCPNGGLPIGISEDQSFIFFDTTSNDSFCGREEIVALNNTNESEHSLTMGTTPSSGTINSYPNPFNPTTTIRYELKEYSEVHLAIFDMLGRKVRDLVHSQQFEGIHSIAWEPNNVSSGTYFARLTTQSCITNNKEVKIVKLAYTK
jgi:hypothetical protein